MELENYNSQIADMVSNSKRQMIANLPQPNMFGGRRPRAHPLPAMNFSPSSLSVGGSPYSGYYGGAMLHGPIYGAHPLRHGGFGWKDVGNAFQSVAKVAAPIVGDVAKDVGKDMLKSYLTGKGRRGRPRKHHPQGGFGWSDIANVGKSVVNVAAPIVTDVAKDVGKDMLKSYLTGKGKPRGRPRKHHTPIHPYGGAMMSTAPMSFAHLDKSPSPMSSAQKQSMMQSFLQGMGNNGIVSEPLRDIRLRRGGKVPKWLQSVGNAFTSPTAKEIYKDVGTAAAIAAMGLGHPPKRGRKARALAQHYAAAHGGFGWKDIGNAFKDAGKFVGNEILVPVAKEVGKDVLKSAITGKGGARAARGAIVKQVMAKHGLSLPAASKFVKEHGLY
jgi:hypothetical protein